MPLARDARDVRLYVLDTGLIECTDYAIFSPGAHPGTRREMSVRSYLVVHPEGVLLWDTGIADEIAAEPEGRRITDALVFKVPRTLASQLAEIGLAPEQVEVLGLSHLHIDHVGNVALFPEAAVVMQDAEREAAYGPDAERLTYIPATYAALRPEKIRTVAGRHDVFGDGTVVMVPLPGHTPGHQGLIVTLRGQGPILLATDIAYSEQDFRDAAVRPSNVDLEQSRRSIEEAQRLERELGVTVWLHHDLGAQATVLPAPAAYR